MLLLRSWRIWRSFAHFGSTTFRYSQGNAFAPGSPWYIKARLGRQCLAIFTLRSTHHHLQVFALARVQKRLACRLMFGRPWTKLNAQVDYGNPQFKCRLMLGKHCCTPQSWAYFIACLLFKKQCFVPWKMVKVKRRVSCLGDYKKLNHLKVSGAGGRNPPTRIPVKAVTLFSQYNNSGFQIYGCATLKLFKKMSDLKNIWSQT